MHPQSTDETDSLPVWACAASEELVDGLLAVDRLGVGTRCETWLVWSLDLWHPVVVKLARPHQREHPRAVQSLRREADALRRVAHPATPRLIHDGTGSGLPHVVTEYVDGPSVADLVDESGPMAPGDVALLGCQLLGVLTALHSRGLVHVDVKPENVLVRDGRPYLVDFGSARAIGSTQPAGKPVGTEGYAAPEMEACEPLSAAMDLFGLGTVLAEGLTGSPFPDGAALPVTPVTPLVVRLLSAEPDDRGPAHEVLAALARCAPERPWPVWADDRLAV